MLSRFTTEKTNKTAEYFQLALEGFDGVLNSAFNGSEANELNRYVRASSLKQQYDALTGLIASVPTMDYSLMCAVNDFRRLGQLYAAGLPESKGATVNLNPEYLNVPGKLFSYSLYIGIENPSLYIPTRVKLEPFSVSDEILGKGILQSTSSENKRNLANKLGILETMPQIGSDLLDNQSAQVRKADALMSFLHIRNVHHEGK